MIQPIDSAMAGAVDPLNGRVPENGDSEGANGSTQARNDTIDQNQFLMLFISQLQNQDPLNPLDVNGLTAQLAQFSSLEQLFSINSNLKALEEVSGNRETFDPLSFLGKEVSVPDGTIAIEDGEATPIVLDMLPDATGVQVTVLGPDGRAVRQIDLGLQPAGEVEFVFDGKDTRGVPVADGLYTVQVTARGGNDGVVPVETVVRGTVTGVDLTEEPPALLLGLRRVPLSEVREIRSSGEESGST
jgi:flagellar basal-body rod modification protein FlgD